MANFTLEELLAEKQRRMSGGQATQNPQATQYTQATQGQPDLNSILSKLGVGSLSHGPITKAAVGFGRSLQGKDVATQDNDLAKLYQQEAIKQQFEDPTVRQLREAEIKALGQEPPKGFVRQGKQLLPDPDYVKPADQLKIDEDRRAQEATTENIRGRAEQNLSSIAEAKKGSKYFGPLGGLPTLAAPSTYIPGGGNYAGRKMWENNINQLLSQKVVDLITEMKQASKTGATGFGSLTEKEGAILREASTALSKDLPEEQALYYLNEMEKINRKILDGGSSQQVGGFDADKEARYQAWKASQNATT